MSDVREDLGYVPRERKPGKRPPTDREVVTSWPGFERVGDTGDELVPWCVVLKRKSGKRTWVYGQTEAEALARARQWIEGGGL